MLEFKSPLKAITNPDEVIITPELRSFIWKRRLEAMSKTVKEVASSAWAAPVLLSLLLGYNIYARQQDGIRMDTYAKEQQLQHDLLVDLKARKEEQDKIAERDRHEIMVQLGEAENWRKLVENKINEVKYQKNNGGSNNHATKEN